MDGKTEQADLETDPQGSHCLCSQRWILGYLGFLFGMVFAHFRVDINMAIVCMASDVKVNVTDNVNASRVYHGINMHNVSYDSRCMFDSSETDDDFTPEFMWERSVQSHILSAYYYGFLVAQIPFGSFIGRFGGKAVTTAFIGVASLTTILIPVLARTHVYAVVLARVIIGASSAPLPAAWMSLVGKWALSNERSRMMMVFWLGQTLGSAFGYITSGVLCAYGFDNGWGSIFYVHGIIGIVFILLWVYFTSDSPETHPRITNAERKLLIKYCHTTQAKRERFFSIPWKKVFTSVPVWAIFLTQLCDNTVFYLIMICLPLFVKEILKFDIKNNGLYSSLPVLSMAASLVSAAVLADYINTKRFVSRTTNRKIFQITGFLMAATFLVLSSYMSCDQRHLVILLFCICTFFQSISISAAFPCNLVDMTPRYAPYIYSVSNTIGSISGIMVPLAVGVLTRNKNIQEWRFVFWVTAGISIFGSIVYGLFSTSEPVTWDAPVHQEIEINVAESKPFIQQNTKMDKETRILKDCKLSEDKSIATTSKENRN